MKFFIDERVSLKTYHFRLVNFDFLSKISTRNFDFVNLDKKASFSTLKMNLVTVFDVKIVYFLQKLQHLEKKVWFLSKNPPKSALSFIFTFIGKSDISILVWIWSYSCRFCQKWQIFEAKGIIHDFLTSRDVNNRG